MKRIACILMILMIAMASLLTGCSDGDSSDFAKKVLKETPPTLELYTLEAAGDFEFTLSGVVLDKHIKATENYGIYNFYSAPRDAQAVNFLIEVTNNSDKRLEPYNIASIIILDEEENIYESFALVENQGSSGGEVFDAFGVVEPGEKRLILLAVKIPVEMKENVQVFNAYMKIGKSSYTIVVNNSMAGAN